jgi:predicted secreted protein
MKPVRCVWAMAVTAIIVAAGGVQTAPGVAHASTGSASLAPVACPNDHYEIRKIELPAGTSSAHEVYELWVGATVAIGLPDNPTTPFTWSESRPVGADTDLPLVGSGYVPDPSRPGMVGTGGVRYFCYQVMSAALTPITFTYHHISSTAQTIHRVVVDIQAFAVGV